MTNKKRRQKFAKEIRKSIKNIPFTECFALARAILGNDIFTYASKRNLSVSEDGCQCGTCMPDYLVITAPTYSLKVGYAKNSGEVLPV